jgi:acyl-CoA thioesterase
MPVTFAELLNRIDHKSNQCTLEITPDWMQGRTISGGLATAFGLETVKKQFPNLPPLRSAMVAFIGPVGGTVTATAKLLRSGKSVTFIEAELMGEKGLATKITFGFGASRESNLDKTYLEPHGQPGPEGFESEPIINPQAAAFSQHIERRQVAGGERFSGSDDTDNYYWMRHRDERASDITALLGLSDMLPPAIIPALRERVPASSMTWMVNMLSETPTTENGWWLIRSCADQAAEGYSSQNMMVWNTRGELVVTGRQIVAVFG